MEFNKYQHIERFGTDEVENIEFGRCFIFYKIDGTIWRMASATFDKDI